MPLSKTHSPCVRLCHPLPSCLSTQPLWIRHPSHGDPTPYFSLTRTFSLPVSLLDHNGQGPWLFCSPLSIQENVWHIERSQTVTVNPWSNEWVNDRPNVAKMPKKSSKFRISAQNKSSTGGESPLYVMPVSPAPHPFQDSVLAEFFHGLCHPDCGTESKCQPLHSHLCDSCSFQPAEIMVSFLLYTKSQDEDAQGVT